MSALLVASASPTLAQTSFWVGGDGSWFDAANWDPDVPDGGDAIIRNSGTARFAEGEAFTSFLWLGGISSGPPGEGTIVQTGGVLHAIVTGLGVFPGSLGRIEISGDAELHGGSTLVGAEGEGNMEVTDGARFLGSRVAIGNTRERAVQAAGFGQGALNVRGAGSLVEMGGSPGVQLGGGGTAHLTIESGAVVRSPSVLVNTVTEDGAELLVIGPDSLLEVYGEGPGSYLDLGYASALFPSLPTPDSYATLTVGPGATVRSTPEIQNTAGGLVRGVGLIDANLRNFEGVIQPGIDGVGDLRITGMLDHTGQLYFGGPYYGCTLEIDIAGVGPGEYDTLTVAAALLGGTLRVNLFDDYSPDVGARFEVLRCLEPDSIDLPDLGDFHALDLPPLAAGGAWAVDVALTGVTLRVAPASGCPADLAEPFGIVDFSDALTFLTAFGAGASPADMDEPFGVYDYSDVLAFMTAFAQGCP